MNEPLIAIVDDEIARLRRVKRRLLANLKAEGLFDVAPTLKALASEPFDDAIREFKTMRAELQGKGREERRAALSRN